VHHLCDVEEVNKSQFSFDFQSPFSPLLCECCRERTQLSIYLPIGNIIMDIFIEKCRKNVYSIFVKGKLGSFYETVFVVKGLMSMLVSEGRKRAQYQNGRSNNRKCLILFSDPVQNYPIKKRPQL
jgi:hypothetical protein